MAANDNSGTFVLQIELGNEAFDGGRPRTHWEIGRILREAADKLQRDYTDTTTPLYDVNGNRVGQYYFVDDASPF